MKANSNARRSSFRDGPQGIDTLVEDLRQVFEEPGVTFFEGKEEFASLLAILGGDTTGEQR